MFRSSAAVVSPIMAGSGSVRPGDVVVFYTDGVAEARREAEFFGDERLAALVEKHRGESASVVVELVLEVPDQDASRS